MKRQVLVNGAILVAALGSLGAVWLTRKLPTTAELEARRHKLLPSWDKDAVTALRLTQAEKTLVLERTPQGEFRIVSPYDERADAAGVSALLGSLDLASYLRSADEVAPQTAGLRPAQARLELEMGGKSQIIALGGPAPAPAGARYAELTLAGQAPRRFVVSQGVAEELSPSLDKFRETRLLEYGRSDFAKIRLRTSQETLELVQRDRAYLLVTPGRDELCDSEALERILTALSRVVSEQFVEPDVARAALGDDAVEVKLDMVAQGSPAVTLRFGGKCPQDPSRELVLREQAPRAARAGCVPASLRQALGMGRAALQLDRPFSARVDEVEELSVKLADQKLELARKDRGFLLRAPSHAEVALEAGNQRLQAVLQARGERVTAPRLAELGLEPAAGEATIQIAGSDAASTRQERVLIGKPRSDGSRCLKRATDEVVLCVAAEGAAAFSTDARLLKSLELFDFSPSDLVRISADSGKLHQSLRRNDDGSFTLEEPQGFAHDGQTAADLVSELGTLRAARWVAASDDGKYGLQPPRLRVVVELRQHGVASRRVLVLGGRSDGGSFATLSPDPAVFFLSGTGLAALEQPLIDRTLCPLPAGELERIELEAGSRRRALQRKGETWQAEGLSSARAAELVEAFSSLRAWRVLHLGTAQARERFTKPSLVVTFVSQQGKRERLLFGAHDDELAYARLDSVDASFAVSAKTYGALSDF
jgi:hypothetical protein